MSEWVDDNGYPTEAALARIRKFHGTPLEMIEFIRSIWWSSVVLASEPRWAGSELTPTRGTRNEDIWLWSLSTGGWSGNEDIIGELENTMFWFCFWWQSTRGGHYIFHLGEPMAHKVGEWGNYARLVESDDRG